MLQDLVTPDGQRPSGAAGTPSRLQHASAPSPAPRRQLHSLEGTLAGALLAEAVAQLPEAAEDAPTGRQLSEAVCSMDSMAAASHTVPASEA